MNVRAPLTFLAVLAAFASLGCGPGLPTDTPEKLHSAPAPDTAEPSPGPAPDAPDDALGGRLYDRFYAKDKFTPDDKKTPGLADGKGGPMNNGTLLLKSGEPLLNDRGHDYRMKNLYGWDLRGPDGIYGAKYQNKPVLPFNLLGNAIATSDLTAFFSAGRDGSPAYGSVLSQDEIRALVAFVTGVREGRLPGPDAIWKLEEGTPGNYRLSPGADPERGKALYAAKCAGCHGPAGTTMLFDDGAYSLGSHARQKAYEDWLKILNGQPGTPMKRFVEGKDGKELGSQVLDLLAALCDRKAFPKGLGTSDDVPDADPRCGEYLR